MSTELLLYLISIQWWIIGFLLMLVTGIIGWAIHQHFEHDINRERTVDREMEKKQDK